VNREGAEVTSAGWTYYCKYLQIVDHRIGTGTEPNPHKGNSISLPLVYHSQLLQA